jgi:hypothetical protein
MVDNQKLSEVLVLDILAFPACRRMTAVNFMK